MEQRLTIISLGVSDLDISTEFYKNCFGWKLDESSNKSIRFFKLNGILLSLYGQSALAEDVGVKIEENGFKGFTMAHNVHSEKEVDQIIEALKAKGVRIIKKPQFVFWGGYSSYISDPDGHLWEIAYNPFMPLDKAGNTV